MAEDFSPVCGEEILHVSNLSVNRSGDEIINDINMSITCGEFVGIVGPNGGGKSTLILTLRNGNCYVVVMMGTISLTLILALQSTPFMEL